MKVFFDSYNYVEKQNVSFVAVVRLKKYGIV